MRTLIAIAALTALLGAGCGEDFLIPATGTVYGDLVDAQGTPVPGIEVLIEGTDLSAVSNARGRFVINGVLAVDEAGMGKYYTVRGRGERNGVPVGFIVTHFKVKGQQSYGVGTVTVPPTGSIRGRLHLAGTSDHSGVRISIEGTSISTVTRADGTFVLDRVPAHEGYLLPCEKAGFESMTIDRVPGTENTPISVSPGTETVLPQTDMNRAS